MSYVYKRKYRSWTIEETGLANRAKMVLSRALEVRLLIKPEKCDSCGRACRFKAKIEEHTEYNGEKQTVVSRPKVTEEVQ